MFLTLDGCKVSPFSLCPSLFSTMHEQHDLNNWLNDLHHRASHYLPVGIQDNALEQFRQRFKRVTMFMHGILPFLNEKTVSEDQKTQITMLFNEGAIHDIEVSKVGFHDYEMKIIVIFQGDLDELLTIRVNRASINISALENML
jgi:hypothetical protein